jgi:hypothetical protein
MTPEQVKLVQDSFRKVMPIAGTAADLFYDQGTADRARAASAACIRHDAIPVPAKHRPCARPVAHHDALRLEPAALRA